MTGPLSDIGTEWALMVHETDAQVAMLRRRAADMADALDREARRAIEGARDWRRLDPETTRRENRHAGTRP